MKAVLKLSFILSIVLYCSNLSFAGDEDWSKVRSWIEDTDNKMEKALVEGNGEFMISLYADDAYSLPSYEPMMHGKNQLVDSHKKMMESGFKFNTVDFEVVDVMGSGDMAVEIGKYQMNMTIPGMQQPIDDNGKYITVWKKIDGNWKIIAETWNSDINPWQEMMSQGESSKDMK
jgi:uncharacterized protein (TIGR02246 family)